MSSSYTFLSCLDYLSYIFVMVRYHHSGLSAVDCDEAGVIFGSIIGCRFSGEGLDG